METFLLPASCNILRLAAWGVDPASPFDTRFHVNFHLSEPKTSEMLKKTHSFLTK
jgi:hypothetical protein